MKTEYGVPVPRGVRKDWDVSSMDTASSGSLMRRYHTDPMWEDPTRCVAWFDRFERLRVCVAHYPNGRSATLRKDANGKWSMTFGKALVAA